METVRFENIRKFAYVNDDLIGGKINGIIIDFFGLGVQNFYRKPLAEDYRFAKKGYLHIVPYTNPWGWMNKREIAYSQKIIDVIVEKYALEGVPLVTCGASMGGLGALIFSAECTIKPVACVTNCPVCDLRFHFDEHDDMPRTIYDAFYEEGTDFELNVLRSSPMHRIADLPDVKYTLFQCMQDDDVHPEFHSEKFVPAMRALGRTVEYIKVPDSGHCGLNEKYLEMYFQKIEDGFSK